MDEREKEAGKGERKKVQYSKRLQIYEKEKARS